MTLFACLTVPIILIALPLLGFFLRYYSTCLTARRVGIDLPFGRILKIYWEAHKPNRLIACYTMAWKSGVTNSISEIEILLLSGTDPEPIIQAMEAAKESKVDLSWETACAFQMINVDFKQLIDRCKHRNASPEEVQWEMKQQDLILEGEKSENPDLIE